MKFYENSDNEAFKWYNILKRVMNDKLKLIKCLEINGYISEPEPEPEPEFEPEFNSESGSESETEIFPDQSFVPSFTEQQQSSSSTFNRTFIQTTNARTLALQQRAIEQEEVEYNKVKEIVSTVFEALKVNDLDKFVNYAMNMYQNIKKAYNSKSVKGEMKGSIKKGYIFLIIWYTLSEFKICMEREELIVFFQDTTLADIPKADLVMKELFGKKISYSPEMCLTRFKFDQQTLQKIKQIIQVLKDSRIFNKPDATTAQVAAAVYYVKNKLMNDRSLSYPKLSEEFKISSDTIRKTVRVIEKEALKNELLL